jgi:hypothetical protein
MEQYNGNYTDENRRPVKGAAVFVYTSEGATAAITDANDNPIVQPLLTDENGNYSYRAPGGYYRHSVWVAKRRVLIENEVILGPSYRDAAQSAAAAAAAAAGVGEYDDTADGLGATGLGETFWLDNGDGTGTIYRHDPGPVATEIGKFVQDQTAPAAATLLAGGVPTSSALSLNGDVLNAYQPGGIGAVATNIRNRLQRDVWVEDYFAGLSTGGDYQPAFDRAMDVARTRGRSRVRMETMIDTASPIALRSGMSIEGDGTHYRWDNDLEANVYEGAWIRNENAAGGPVLRYGSMQDSRLSGVGIFCGEQPNTVAISIGSDNNPSTQALYFERFIVVGAALAVKWGDSNAANPLEQCDDISFRDFSFHSCVDGIRLDANNVADTSLIERGKFYQMQGLCFDLRNCGILRISECQAGLLYAASRMFKIAGQAPDQLIIQLCQSEGLGGKMIEIDGNNDQGATHLIGCVINQPVECDGILRVRSTGCYINTTIDLDGYVRWTSENDVWDGPLELPQVTVNGSVQFDAVTQRDANGQNGRWLPRGMKVKQANLTAGGYEFLGAVRAGIYGETFTAAADYYFPGFYILPTADNGFAYKVTAVAGAAGAEPAWPTVIGNTVVSGGVTFQCVGASALVKGVGGIQA